MTKVIQVGIVIASVIMFFGSAILDSPSARAQTAQASRPECSQVVDVQSVMDGMYAIVKCPKGSLTVALPVGVGMPQRGPAKVVLVARQRDATYQLEDVTGVRYVINRWQK
jgi:hypothetical protein